MAYRAFYALPPENFRSSTGQTTNAIFGFGSMLTTVIANEEPTHIAVAFDVSRKTFRTQMFPEYKATRAATPDEFRSQISFLFEFVTSLGIKHFAMEGFEADDILATLSTRAAADGFDVLICSGDRDSFQLVTNQITVLYPSRGVTELNRMTPEAVIEKYGLTPLQYPDFAALRGDPSDNLPSIPGVGEKTATKWIQDYGSLSALIARADEISGKAGVALRDHLPSVELNRELTALRHDLEIDAAIDDLSWDGPDFKAMDSLLDTLEIKALKTRIHSLFTGVIASPSLSPSGESEPRSNERILVESAIKVTEITSAELSKLLLGRTDPIAIYCSKPLPGLSGGGPSGEGTLFNDSYSVALSADECFAVTGGAGEWLQDPTIPKYVHGAKNLLRYADIGGIIFDTELAAYLINPGARNLELTDLSERFLEISIPIESVDLFSQFNQSNPILSGIIFSLVEHLQREVDARELGTLLATVELPSTFELARMERLGVGVDVTKLQELKSFFYSELERETLAAQEIAGHEFNVGSPKQLQVILFDELNLPKTKKIKTGYTTDAESLEMLFEKTQHPFLSHLLRIRETGKLLTTVDGLLSATQKDGRIHTTFQQTVTATGRLSSTDPNLQNIPVRTDEGRRIRDCFVAEEPFENLLTADYSQIEMRIMAHLSGDEQLIAAFKTGEDLHSTVGSYVFGVDVGKVTPEMRRQIKAMSYGLAYGLSSFGLAQQLNLSPGQAQDLMLRYFERFGGIQDYLKKVVEEARVRGYTETILGRRRYLPDLTSDNRQRREVAERMALNAPIQGSAADIIKIAMLNVVEALLVRNMHSRLLLQVHDELILEIAPGEEVELSELVRNSMESAIALSLPLSVNIGVGKSWDLAAH